MSGKYILCVNALGEVIVKLRETSAAGLYVASPACDEVIVQLPAFNNVTVPPLVVQTFGVSLLKLTGKPDEAVALTVNGGSPSALLGSGSKAMVCTCLNGSITMKLRTTSAGL